MSDIRLTAHFPNTPPATVRVEQGDLVIDWLKMSLNDYAIHADPANCQVLKNNQAPVGLDTSFGNAGFTNGDEIYIHLTSQVQHSPSPLTPFTGSTPTQAPAHEKMEQVKVAQSFHQLGILVLDGSGSMKDLGNGGISLADWVNRAVREFLGLIKQSEYVKNFSMAVVTFDHTTKIHTNIIALEKIDDFSDYNPLANHGGGTYVGGALEAAETIANQFLNNPSSSVPHEVRIIVMSDGLCQAPDQTREVANRIKKNRNIMICSTLFTQAANAGKEEIIAARTILSEIASLPYLYNTTFAGEDLRKFFISSMSAKRNFGNV